MQSAKNLQNLEELTLLKVRLWLVLEYLGTGIFGNFGTGRGEFSSFLTGIPGASALESTVHTPESRKLVFLFALS